MYKELLDRLSDGVYFVDRNRQILYWNEGGTRLTGYKPEEMVGRYCHENTLCHVDSRGRELCHTECPLSACMRDGKPREAELFLMHKMGRRVPVNVRVQPVRETDGTIVGAIEIFSDNSAQIEAKRRAEAMERLAFYDPVTHCPNRRFLEMSLNTAQVEYQAHRDPFGVLVFDLDDFKEVNDTFGHATGDRALQEVAKTLMGALRNGDVVGRWGGDEFLAIVYNVNEAVLDGLAKRCAMLVGETSFRDDDGNRQRVSVSVGAALVGPGEEACKVVERADRRMYRHKKQLRAQQVV